MNGREISLLFPGQASQYVGMGKALADRFPIAAEFFARADKVLPFSISAISFEGPEDILADTRFQQPAILTASVAAFSVLQDQFDLNVILAAGHSLGEYSALVAAGSIDFEDAVLLVKKRGDLMHKAVSKKAGGMLALLGIGTIDAKALCKAVSQDGDECFPANFNCPGQVVISGTTLAIGKAKARAKEFGVRRAIVLPVSAPFHSPYMKQAAVEFAQEIKKVKIRPPKFDVYSNVSALPHVYEPKSIGDALVKQIDSPVLFEDILRHIGESNPKGLTVECGPGKVLTGFIKKTAPHLSTTFFGEAEDFETVDQKINE